MRLIGFLCLCMVCPTASFAQLHKWTVGAGLGSAFYLGDLNPNRLFDKPQLMGSLFGAYEWNEQFSTRIQMSTGGIAGTVGGTYLPGGGRSFKRAFGLMDVRNEFNFMPYTATYNANYAKNRYTPFFHFGLGGGFLPNGFFQIPVGIGIKYKLNAWLNLAWEWTFHKTFSDQLDGINPTPDHSKLINNDWISYSSVSLSIPLSKNCNCFNQ